jgi:SAM-dependent methyltransferase
MNLYEHVPYASKLNRARHIDALGTMARLYGYLPVAPHAARVLEIGCASGEALFPLAYEYPQAQFVGIDTSSRHIDVAQQRLTAFQDRGPGNLVFLHGDVTHRDLRGQKFDYIICHGVLSWIPLAERETLLGMIPTLLSDQGVCFLSYNCGAGSAMRKVIWDQLKDSVTALPSDIGNVRSALRAFRDAIEINYEKPYQVFVFQELDRILQEPDHYLIHEVFALQNEPLSFDQLQKQLAQLSLKVIGDVRPHRVGLQRFLAADLSAQSYQALSTLQQQFHFSAERIVDFCFGTPFRETLIMHGFHEGALHLSPEVFHALSFSHVGVATDEHCSPVEQLLLDQYPHFISYAELTSAALQKVHGLDAERVSADLMRCFVQDRILASFYPPEVSATVYAFPKTTPWIRYQAEHHEIVTNLQYRSIALDSLARGLLAHLDGETSHETLQDVALSMIKSGEGGVREDGVLVEDPIRIASLVPALVESALETLKKAAMLLP